MSSRNPTITDKMLDSYREKGFVVVRDLIGDEECQGWIRRLVDIVEGRVEIAPDMLVMKDVMVAKGAVTTSSPIEAIAKLQDYEQDPVLDTYTTNDAILDCVERIIGDDVMTIHTMLINKPPNVDGRHPLHQDLLYFPFRPADSIVATWTALERVTVENGCLVVVPGSHRGELLRHENPDWEHLNGGYFGAKDVDDLKAQRIHLEMDPGDTVFFHPILLHGSGRNRTDSFRRAISAHYANTRVSWEWTVPKFDNRHYRVVRGKRAGEEWEGERNQGTPVNPLDYIPLAPAIELMKSREKAKQTESSGE